MKKHYSKEELYSEAPVLTYWNNIELSPKTIHERNRVKLFIDDFASFTWRGIDAFKTFGAFIINNKNSLKFYNGPSFTNEYTKPQFETAAGQLTGVTFQIQKIDFMMGVYWISEEDYRQMIYWLHPYEINTLTFGFEPNYYYQVKLSAIDNGNRYIVGYENGEPRYYTEMKVTFELQGPPVAYGNTYFDFKTDNFSHEMRQYDEILTCTSDLDSHEERKGSNLETPIIIEMAIDLSKIIPSNTHAADSYVDDLLISAYVQYVDSESIQVNNQPSQKLFEVTLKNLFLGLSVDNNSNIWNITYNSESALLFLQHGDSMRELLTKLTTLTTGDRLVDSLSVEQFNIPGLFDDYTFKLQNMKINYQVTILNQHFKFQQPAEGESWGDGYFSAQVYSRPRNNLI